MHGSTALYSWGGSLSQIWAADMSVSAAYAHDAYRLVQDWGATCICARHT